MDALSIAVEDGVKFVPKHVTLEPNECNTDGYAVTLYFEGDATVEDAAAYLKKNGVPSSLGLTVDLEDEFFEVLKTDLQPFGYYSRFQAHPTC